MFIGIMSNLIVLPPTLLLTILFKKGGRFSKRTSRIDLTVKEATQAGKINWEAKPYKRTLPFKRWNPGKNSMIPWCLIVTFRPDKSWSPVAVVIAWILSFICIAGGSFVVFAYGVTFGNEKSYQWIVSMITSFFSSVLITQPLKVALIRI